eukprot:4922647-Pyramimonas_sp.AAC.1
MSFSSAGGRPGTWTFSATVSSIVASLELGLDCMAGAFEPELDCMAGLLEPERWMYISAQTNRTSYGCKAP